MKLANGLGSIYKESGKRNKKWRVMVTLGYDENGKQIRKSLGYYERKLEAQQVLSDYHADKSKYLDSSTMGDLFELLIERKEKVVSKSSLQGYKSAWKRLKTFQNEQIKNITTKDLQDVIDVPIKEGIIGYGAAKQYKGVASSIFDLAIELGQIRTNFANFIILPKRKKQDNRIFSDEDILKFKNDDSLWSKVTLLNIFLLARPSEVLEIKISNVNLEKNYITLGSKTEAGTERYVPIHNEIKELVKEFYYSSSDGYLCNYMDKKIEYGTYLANYTKNIEKLGIEYLSPHKCRKTGATLFTRSGISELHLKRIMGHTNFKVTEKYYIGNLNKEIQNAVNNLVIE